MTLRDLLPPLTRPMLGFDLETTGTNRKIARIVSLGIEIMMPGKPTKKYSRLINPGVPIPPGSTKVHGITDEQVKDAPTFPQIADQLLVGFAEADFCGFNVRFDTDILAEEFFRARKVWNYEGARIIDSLRLWQITEPRSLDDAVGYWIGVRLAAVQPELAAQYQREIAEAGSSHDAMRDVLAATRVTAAQMICCPDKLPRDIGALHTLCWPGWFDAQGKLQWRDGQLCVMFGVHREKSLRQVPRDYLHWMANKGDFSTKVKDVCRAALHGEYPEPVSEGLDDPDDEV